MSTDLTTSDSPATDNDGTPFVRVYADKASGRAVIALDADAADALLQYLDDIGPSYDLAMNPGNYGVSDDDGVRISNIISRISGPLNKARGYL